MKINIVTCHTPQNYGAVLQAYALQTYLEKQNCKVEFIDYFPDHLLEKLSLSYVGNARIRKNFILKIIYILYKLPGRITRRRNFGKFLKKHLHITKERYTNYEQLCNSSLDADLFICGSDQIWNTQTGMTGFDPVYYLDFVRDSRKKVSYAASMSIEEPLQQRVKELVFCWINKLDHISVREKCIAEKIQPYIDKPVSTVVDPVFLLTKEDWKFLADTASAFRGRYILTYPMGEGSDVLKNAKLLSRKTGLPIYCITASHKRDKAVKRYFNCSVPAFLQLFINAEYVVTNSFHGTCFSILFEKNFWSCSVEHNNHRILSVLRLFGLESRYVSGENLLDGNMPDVNYPASQESIRNAIDSSKSFLETVLQKDRK